MTEEAKKLLRMEKLAEIIRKCRMTPPELSDKDIAIVLFEETGLTEKFLREFKRLK